MAKLTPDDPAFWSQHGIADEVRDARGYCRYEKGDPEGLLAEDWRDQANRDFIASTIAPAGPGWIIKRRPPPGLGLPHVYAELRPNKPVEWPEENHWHERRPPTDDERRKLNPERIMTAWEARRHIAKPRHQGGHGGRWDGHGVHRHRHKAKYLLPKGEGRAKRIDCHPLAAKLLPDAERIYFGIEGCLKADAILSAIVASGVSASVVSVPSVTLWPWRREEGGELERVAKRYFRDRQVVIVPDGDWWTNFMVYRQAFLLRTFLERLEIEAHVAAPPPVEDDPGDDDGKPLLNGADDYLGSGIQLGEGGRVWTGGELGDFLVIDRPVPDTVAFLAAHYGELKMVAKRHGASLLRALALHSGIDVLDGKTMTWANDGKVSYSLATLGSMLGTTPKEAQRAMRALADVGIVDVDGSDEAREGWARRGTFLGNSEQSPALDSEGRPTDKSIYWQPYDYKKKPTYQLPQEIWPKALRKTPLDELQSSAPSYPITDLKERMFVRIETRLLKGHRIADIAEATGESVDVVKKASAEAKFNAKTIGELRGESVPLVIHLPGKTRKITFEGERGQRVIALLTLEGSGPVEAVAKGPANKTPRILSSGEIDSDHPGLALSLDIKHTGTHELGVEAIARPGEISYADEPPEDIFDRFAVVTVELRSVTRE